MKAIKDILKESLLDGNPYTSRNLRKVVELAHRANCNGQIKIVMNNHRFKGNYRMNNISICNNKLQIAIENLKDKDLPITPTNSESKLGKSKLIELRQILQACIDAFEYDFYEVGTGKVFIVDSTEIGDNFVEIYLNR